MRRNVRKSQIPSLLGVEALVPACRIVAFLMSVMVSLTLNASIGISVKTRTARNPNMRIAINARKPHHSPTTNAPQATPKMSIQYTIRVRIGVIMRRNAMKSRIRFALRLSVRPGPTAARRRDVGRHRRADYHSRVVKSVTRCHNSAWNCEHTPRIRYGRLRRRPVSGRRPPAGHAGPWAVDQVARGAPGLFQSRSDRGCQTCTGFNAPSP